MDTNQEKWLQCLQLIKQKITTDDWVYPTWFAPLQFESFNPDTRALLLRVPSKYIYEYVEHYYSNLLGQVIASVFGPDASVHYRLLQNGDGAPVDFLLSPPARVPQFAIPDGTERLRNQMQQLLDSRLKWLPAYDTIGRWLSGNKGRGLLMLGTSGVGKTLLCQQVLPAIFQRTIPIVSASDLYKQVDSLSSHRCVIVDDLGREPEKRYGQTDRSFFQLCNEAERRGILLILSTHLSTSPVSDERYPDSIQHRYGNDVLSRLRSLVLPVEIEGPDLRR